MKYMKNKYGDENGNIVSFWSTDDNVLCGNNKMLRENLDKINDQLDGVIKELKCVNTSSSILTDKNIYYDDSNNSFHYTYDYTELFQKIINNSKIIYIPKGEYYLSKPLTINTSTIIISNGANFYCNPKTSNSSAFVVLANDVLIHGINIISKNVYAPKIGENNVTGKSSNIYGFLIRGNNCKLDSCNVFDCFSLAYIRGYDSTYDGITTNKIIKNIILQNCNAYDSVFGVFTAFVDNVNVVNSILNNNESGLNDFCHNIYIGTQSSNITFNNVILGEGVAQCMML